MNNLVLEAKGLSRYFTDAEHRLEILNDLQLAVSAGERLAIIGSSGSGKSTLLHLLAGLDKPDAGEVLVQGESFNGLSEAARAGMRNRHLGFVFQFHHLLPEFSALENVAVPMLLANQPINHARERATRLLEQVGLAERARHRPAKLSGGERQRVAIARALANSPGCVLMDEPTGNLDPQTAHEVETYLQRLNTELGIAFVMVTHDHDLATRMDRTLLLNSGRLESV
ncbi:MAG TPA: ABC transporter ATP-binding protein [Marinobacterium sp.]|nr:ABC transporter ATP-binding protein [Marinobacterium sp.]